MCVVRIITWLCVCVRACECEIVCTRVRGVFVVVMMYACAYESVYVCLQGYVHACMYVHCVRACTCVRPMCVSMTLFVINCNEHLCIKYAQNTTAPLLAISLTLACEHLVLHKV